MESVIISIFVKHTIIFHSVASNPRSRESNGCRLLGNGMAVVMMVVEISKRWKFTATRTACINAPVDRICSLANAIRPISQRYNTHTHTHWLEIRTPRGVIVSITNYFWTNGEGERPFNRGLILVGQLISRGCIIISF